MEAGDTAAFSFRFVPFLFLSGPSHEVVVGFLSGFFAACVHYLVVFLLGGRGWGLGLVIVSFAGRVSFTLALSIGGGF